MLPRAVNASRVRVELTGAEGKVSPILALAVEATTLKFPVLFSQSVAVKAFLAVIALGVCRQPDYSMRPKNELLPVASLQDSRGCVGGVRALEPQGDIDMRVRRAQGNRLRGSEVSIDRRVCGEDGKILSRRILSCRRSASIG